MSNSPDILPYFPLSVFLFPGEDIPLRIFEPRYKQLIEEARTTGITFAIPYVREKEIQELGCEVRLIDVVAESPGGRMVVTIESLSIVQIINFSGQLEGKLYAGGKVKRLPDADLIENSDLLGLINSYTDEFDSDFLKPCNRPAITHQDVIRALNLSSEEKFKFICLPDMVQKEVYLAGQLRYLKMIRNQESLLGNDFGLN